jgi:hypothetical protein
MVEQAYAQAVRAGLDPETFWRLTPYESNLVAQEGHRRLELSAWMTAAFDRTKKLPPIDKLLRGKRSKKQVAKDLHAALKGVK